MISSKKLFLFFLLTASTYVSLVIDNAYAHIPQDNNTSPVQEWNDEREKIKIQFSYSPEKPLIYTTTDLIFSIQNLNTGNHIEDLLSDITVLKGNKIFFKFHDVAIEDGDLFLKVNFLEDGNYQVINHVRSKDNIAIALASFNILVPLQPFGKFNIDSLTSLLVPAGIAAVVLSASVIVLVIISRKKRKSEPREENG